MCNALYNTFTHITYLLRAVFTYLLTVVYHQVCEAVPDDLRNLDFQSHGNGKDKGSPTISRQQSVYSVRPFVGSGRR